MKIELAKTEIIHFVGIGGIGMSGLALIMKRMGFNIQGSDLIINKINDFNVYISYTLMIDDYDYHHNPSTIYEIDITRVKCLGKFDQGSIPELDSVFIVKR